MYACLSALWPTPEFVWVVLGVVLAQTGRGNGMLTEGKQVVVSPSRAGSAGAEVLSPLPGRAPESTFKTLLRVLALIYFQKDTYAFLTAESALVEAFCI